MSTGQPFVSVCFISVFYWNPTNNWSILHFFWGFRYFPIQLANCHWSISSNSICSVSSCYLSNLQCLLANHFLENFWKLHCIKIWLNKSLFHFDFFFYLLILSFIDFLLILFPIEDEGFVESPDCHWRRWEIQLTRTIRTSETFHFFKLV